MPSNPYYIPRENQTLDLLNLGLKLYGLKQQGDIAEKSQALTAEEIRMKGQNAVADQMLNAERTVQLGEHNKILGRQADTQALSARTEAAKLPVHSQEYGFGDNAIMKMFAGELGFKGDDNLLVQKSKELAETTGVKKVDAWQMLRNDDSLRQAAIENISKKMEKGIADNPDYLNTKEGNFDYQKLQGLSSPEGWQQLIDWKFQNTVNSYKMAQEAKNPLRPDEWAIREVQAGRMTQEDASKFIAETMHPRAEAKGQVVGPGATLIGPEGEQVYTNPNRPEGSNRPVSVAPGGTLVNPQTGKPIYTAPAAPEKPPSAAETRVTADDLAKSESLIIGNVDKPEIQPHIDKVNQFSEKPYAWVWKEEKGTKILGMTFGAGGVATKIQLPKIKGVQVKAKDVWEKAARDGLTYDDVLRALGVIK